MKKMSGTDEFFERSMRMLSREFLSGKHTILITTLDKIPGEKNAYDQLESIRETEDVNCHVTVNDNANANADFYTKVLGFR